MLMRSNSGNTAFADSLAMYMSTVLSDSIEAPGVNPQKLQPMSSRTYIPNQYGGSTNKWVRTRTSHPVYRRSNGLCEIHFPNWAAYAPGGGGGTGGVYEVVPGGAATSEGCICTYIDYLTLSTKTVTFTDKVLGTPAGAAADGADFVFVGLIDPLPGTKIRFDFAGNFPSANGMPYAQWNGDVAGGDLFQFGASQILLASTPTNSFPGNRAWYGPSEILMFSAGESVCGAGDSRCFGLNDAANDNFGATGNIGRLVAKYMPFANIGVAGDTASSFVYSSFSQSPRRLAIAKKCTRLITAWGINDTYFQNDSVAQLDANITAAEAKIGLPCIRATLNPVVTSGSTNTILAPQGTTGGGDARRQSFNNTIVRVKPVYYDIAASDESGSTGTFASLTYIGADGTHESNLGNEFPIDKTSALAVLVWLGNPSKLVFITPTQWDSANKSSTLVLSNGNLTATSTGSSSPPPQVVSIRGATAGKKFFSTTLTGTQTVNQGILIVGSGFNPSSDGGSGPKSISASGDGGFYGNSVSLGGGLGTWAVNDIIDIAIDIDAKLFWARRNGGNWNNSGTANPATGVGGANISFLTGTIFPADCPWPNVTHTVNFGALAYTYPAPAGFNNW